MYVYVHMYSCVCVCVTKAEAVHNVCVVLSVSSFVAFGWPRCSLSPAASPVPRAASLVSGHRPSNFLVLSHCVCFFRRIPSLLPLCICFLIRLPSLYLCLCVCLFLFLPLTETCFAPLWLFSFPLPAVHSVSEMKRMTHLVPQPS